MQLVRRKRKDPQTGAEKVDRKFTLRFADHVGREHSLALFERRAPSEAWAKRLQVLIDAKASGEHLRPDMIEWIGNIKRSHLDSIIRWGIIDARRIASTVPISEHVDAWERSLKNEGRGIRHLKNTITRVRTAFSCCGVGRWSDIDARTVSNWLAEQREACDWASRTHLAYIQSLKQFCKWMMVNELAVQDPLISLRRVNSHVQKVNRGAFTIEQCRALVDATAKSDRRINGVDGPTRALAYRIAIQTGLRLGEIAQLTVSAIRWAGEKQPLTTINLREDESKAGKSTGKKTVLPVRRELEPYLRQAAAGRHARAFLLPNMWSKTARYGEGGPKDGAEMLRHDLALVGLPYVDENGERYDFHALRHTYVTLNMQSGMTLTEGMLLNRHADSKTTSGYMHTQILKSRDALEKVPGLDASDPQESGQSAEAPRMAAGAESMARPLARTGGEIPVDSGEETSTFSAQKRASCDSFPLSKSVGWGFESLLPCHLPGTPPGPATAETEASSDGGPSEPATPVAGPGRDLGPASGPSSPVSACDTPGILGKSDGFEAAGIDHQSAQEAGTGSAQQGPPEAANAAQVVARLAGAASRLEEIGEDDLAAVLRAWQGLTPTSRASILAILSGATNGEEAP